VPLTGGSIERETPNRGEPVEKRPITVPTTVTPCPVTKTEDPD